jgi:hypothetical protein
MPQSIQLTILLWIQNLSLIVMNIDQNQVNHLQARPAWDDFADDEALQAEAFAITNSNAPEELNLGHGNPKVSNSTELQRPVVQDRVFTDDDYDIIEGWAFRDDSHVAEKTESHSPAVPQPPEALVRNLEPLPFIPSGQPMDPHALNRAALGIDHLRRGSQQDQQIAHQSGLAIANDAAVAHLQTPYSNQANIALMANNRHPQLLINNEQMAIQADARYNLAQATCPDVPPPVIVDKALHLNELQQDTDPFTANDIDAMDWCLIDYLFLLL